MLVSGGADWTVRCWDVKSAGGQVKPRENGMDESSGLRTEEDENSETYVPEFTVSIQCDVFTLVIGPTYLQPSPRSGLP
jgi:hypothetical protein